MSNRRDQINTFIRGLINDAAPNVMSNEALYNAVNIDLKEKVGGLVNIKGTTDIEGLTFDSGDIVLAAFQVTATFDVSETEREAFVIFTVDNSKTDNRIYIFDAVQQGLYKIYDDAQAPVRNRLDKLALGGEIDFFYFVDRGEHWCYWIDGVNPIRHIRLHVADTTQADNSVSPRSNLYIANEPDLLYVQRLYPVDALTLSSVGQNGGALKAGSYLPFYRYYNSVHNIYSTFSIIGNPIPIVESDTAGGTNFVRGSGPGVETSKKITLGLARTHFHTNYYDSIQLGFIVDYGAGEPISALLLNPSKAFYTGSAAMDFTGRENVIETILDDIVVDDAQLLTGRAIEEIDGRIHLLDPKYSDLSFNADTATIETLFDSLSVPVDPMTNTASASQGYYDEKNCVNKRGYFRGEVYVFAKTYVNKFGQWGRPLPWDCSTQNQYEPSSHALTYQYNWADSGKGFKFLDRHSKEGCLFHPSDPAIRILGLNIDGVNNHPDWAYGCLIVRMPRVKNILGQTPVVNGAAFMGNAWRTDNELETASFTSHHYENTYGWDYDGSEDYFGPKISAFGAAKDLIVQQIANNQSTNFDWPYLKWTLGGGSTSIGGRMHGLLWLYPLEYLANQDGTSKLNEITLQGSEYLRVIDAVNLYAFNAYRNENYYEGMNNGTFADGHQSKYTWIYSPESKESYYYYNSSTPNKLLETGTPAAANPIIPVAHDGLIPIGGGWFVQPGNVPIDMGKNMTTDDVTKHIRKLLNGTALADAQTKNELNGTGIWKDIQMAPPFPFVNQKALVVYEATQNTTIKHTIDPTYYVYVWYTIGPGTFSELFGSTVALHSNTSHTDTTVTDISSGPASVYTNLVAEFEDNKVINPGSGVVFFIANIEKGLGDDRYGDFEQSQPFISTGAYTSISESDISSNTPKNFDVFGGDCYITRNVINVRQNAPKKNHVDIVPTESSVVAGQHTLNATPAITAEDTTRTSSYNSFNEFIDVWVESTVNGHYMVRDDREYPWGFLTRDSDNTDIGGTPVYQYPDDYSLQYDRASLYLYNMAYSIENSPKVFSSQAIDELVLTSFIEGRIHHSEQRLLNSNVIGFDRWLANNRYDLHGAYGAGRKLIQINNRNMMVLQRNGIAILSLGNTLTTDTEGLTIGVSSGDIIGYAQYLELENESGGLHGINSPYVVQKTDRGIFILDPYRCKLYVYNGNGLRSLGDNRVSKMLQETFLAGGSRLTDEDIMLFHDKSPERNRLIIMRNDPVSGFTRYGLTYLINEGVFESKWQVYRAEGGGVNSIIRIGYAADNTYAIFNDVDMGLSIHTMYTNDNRTNIFGYQSISYFGYILNADSYLNKSLINVRIHTYDDDIDYVVAQVLDNTGAVRSSGTVSNSVKLREMLIFNQFLDTLQSDRRIKGQNIHIDVYINSETGEVHIPQIATKYRIVKRTR